MPDPVPYRLPDLGEGMAEAEIVRWEVAVGDHVRRDQIVPGLWHRTKQEKFGSPVVGHATKLKMLASACFSYVRFAVARVVQPAG